MGKIKWLGVVLVAVSIALIAVILDGGTAVGQDPAEPTATPTPAAGGFASGGTDTGPCDFAALDADAGSGPVGAFTLSGTCEYTRNPAVGSQATCSDVKWTVVGVVTLPVKAEDRPGLSTCTIDDLGGSFLVTLKLCTLIDVDYIADPGTDFFDCSGATAPGTSTPKTFKATVSTIPFSSATFLPNPTTTLPYADSSDPSVVGLTLEDPDFDTELSPPAVGGIAETLDTGGGTDSPLDTSSGSGFNYAYASFGGALAGAALIVAVVGGWYLRRRWLP